MLVASNSFSLFPSDFPGISQKTTEIQLKFREREKNDRGKQVGESGFGIWQIGLNFEHDSSLFIEFLLCNPALKRPD